MTKRKDLRDVISITVCHCSLMEKMFLINFGEVAIMLFASFLSPFGTRRWSPLFFSDQQSYWEWSPSPETEGNVWVNPYNFTSYDAYILYNHA